MKSEKTILIIDDDSKNIYALSAVLKAKKYKSLSALGAKSGIELLKKDPSIGIILLDMMMPEMDGYQALALLKADEQLKQIPVVAVTAQAMTGDKEKCLQAGANAYLSKPVDIARLVEIIEQFI